MKAFRALIDRIAEISPQLVARTMQLVPQRFQPQYASKSHLSSHQQYRDPVRAKSLDLDCMIVGDVYMEQSCADGLSPIDS